MSNEVDMRCEYSHVLLWWRWPSACPDHWSKFCSYE